MKWLAGVLIVLMLMLSACESMPWQNKSAEPVAQLDSKDSKDSKDLGTTKAPYEAPLVPEPGLALSMDQRFKDIPLPIGLKEDPDRTFIYQSASLQVGRMVYSTRDSLNDLVAFFNRECPTAGWKLQDVLEADGKRLLFAKAGKRMEVQVQSIGISKGRRVSITLRPDTDGGTGL